LRGAVFCEKLNTNKPSGVVVREKLLTIAGNVRLRYAVLWTLALLLVLDIGVRRWERTPDLVLRNEGQSHSVMPYLFRQMRLHRDRPVVAFIGASVMQGVLNATPKTTVPELVQQTLRANGRQVECYNLAVIANGFGDDLALAEESIRNGADLLVFNLPYKLFSYKGALGYESGHRSSAYYLRHRSDFGFLRRKFLLLSWRDYLDIHLQGAIGNIWALYRERQLINLVLTGDTDALAGNLRNWLTEMIRPGTLQAPLAKVGTPQQRDRANVWKEATADYLAGNRDAYEKIVLDRKSRHFRMFELINRLGQSPDVKLLFVISPINRTMNDETNQFAWNKYRQFQVMMNEIVHENENMLLDLTDAVDNRHFTDSDHLTITGNRQMAQALIAPIEQALAEMEE